MRLWVAGFHRRLVWARAGCSSWCIGAVTTSEAVGLRLLKIGLRTCRCHAHLTDRRWSTRHKLELVLPASLLVLLYGHSQPFHTNHLQFLVVLLILQINLLLIILIQIPTTFMLFIFLSQPLYLPFNIIGIHIYHILLLFNLPIQLFDLFCLTLLNLPMLYHIIPGFLLTIVFRHFPLPLYVLLMHINRLLELISLLHIIPLLRHRIICH